MLLIKTITFLKRQILADLASDSQPMIHTVLLHMWSKEAIILNGGTPYRNTSPEVDQMLIWPTPSCGKTTTFLWVFFCLESPDREK